MEATDGMLFYTVREAARELGVSPTMIGRWLKAGVLQEVRKGMGGPFRFLSFESVADLKRARLTNKPKRGRPRKPKAVA